MLCIATGGAVLALAVSGFTLDWTHSVTRGTWWERWEVTPQGLRPVMARITGSGAGMDPPDGARFDGSGWTYAPSLPPQRQVLLGASGATGAGWRLCAGDECHSLGATAGDPVRLWQAAACS